MCKHPTKTAGRSTIKENCQLISLASFTSRIWSIDDRDTFGDVNSIILCLSMIMSANLWLSSFITYEAFASVEFFGIN